MKVLRSDKGREYTSEEFRKYTKERGVIHEFSSPYIHEQNGRAEREIRTIVESARSMLFSKSIDVKLWTEAVNTACYVLNRVILQHHETETPFEKWFNRKPEIKYLRVFGTEAYINVPKEKRKKFEPKSKKITVVGYDGDSSNYRLWYKKTAATTTKTMKIAIFILELRKIPRLKKIAKFKIIKELINK